MDERENLPSASSMRRYIECPGSFLAAAGLPEETSPDSDRGTRIHSYLAGEKVELTDEESEVAEACERLALDTLQSWAPEGWVPDDTEILKETRLWLTLWTDRIFSGKADVIWRHGTKFLVVDYKTGRNATEPADTNSQLVSLAALIAANFMATEVTVAIVAPLQNPSVTKAVWADDALDAVLNLTERTAYLVTQPNQPLKAGDWCRYCKANGLCDATKKAVETMAVTTIAESDGVTITPAEMGDLLQRVRLAERTCRAIRAKAARMLEAGEQVPGVFLKPGSVREKIVDLRTVFGRCVDRSVMPSEFVGSCTITKTALKSVLKEATGTKGKVLEGIVAEVLNGATEKKQNKPTLAFVGDEGGDDDLEA